MKRKSNLVQIICEIAIIAALGFVFDELQGVLFKGVFVNGGSIGFAMIAVLVIAYRRGPLAAFIVGLLMGGFDIATSAYILHPAQLLLDYILPYSLVAVAGFFKPLFDKATSKGLKITWLLVGTLAGGIAKFISHYLAGVIFWADPSGFAWDLNYMNPYLYCFIYNIAFIGPSIVICGALLVAIYLSAPRLLNAEPFIKIDEEKKKDVAPIVLSSIFGAGGLFTFIYYLIEYIKSFESYEDGSAFGYDFNPDSMVLFVLGFFLVVLCVISFITYFKKKYSYIISSGAFLAITGSSLVYDIARLIRAYNKGKDPNLYWIWFICGTITLLLAAGLFTYTVLKFRSEKAEAASDTSN